MAAGQSACPLCDPGRAVNVSSALQCISCDPGKHTNEEGVTSCENCLSGTAQISPGQTQCLACEAGKYSFEEVDEPIVTCSECASGRYNSLEGQTSCVWCELGKFQDISGLQAVPRWYLRGGRGSGGVRLLPRREDRLGRSYLLHDLLDWPLRRPASAAV